MIERSVRGPVEVLRLAHGKASALDVELLRALSQALDEASAARALVLTGTGRIFSAGLDLFRLLDGGEAYMRELLPTLSATLAKLFFFALSKRHIRQPVRDLLDAHEARIDAEVMRVWTNPEARTAVRRYVERALGARA